MLFLLISPVRDDVTVVTIVTIVTG